VTVDPTTLSNQYFTTLLTSTWVPYTVPGTGVMQYQALGTNLFMMPSDLNLLADAEWLGIAQEYAADNTLFLNEFAAAWTRLVNIDRFAGPLGNACPTTSPAAFTAPTVVAGALMATLVLALFKL